MCNFASVVLRLLSNCQGFYPNCEPCFPEVAVILKFLHAQWLFYLNSSNAHIFEDYNDIFGFLLQLLALLLLYCGFKYHWQ